MAEGRVESLLLTGTEGAPKRRGPNRVPFDTTVHPATIEQINALCSYYRCSRGQVLDKLVSVLHTQMTSVLDKAPGRYCVSGERCRFNLVDVPPVL